MGKRLLTPLKAVKYGVRIINAAPKSHVRNGFDHVLNIYAPTPRFLPSPAYDRQTRPCATLTRV